MTLNDQERGPLGKSYEKVHYEFRPAKQVERRMLLDAFQKMMAVGFSISDYQYTGMGSIYFIDFILFHRYLGIRKLVSVEASEDVKRVRFNRPFRLVKIKHSDIAEVIPHLSTDLHHILWLDYDEILGGDIIYTVELAASHLSAGSFLLITVDVEPPGRPEDGPDGWGPEAWRRYFLEEAEDYLSPQSSATDFGRSSLAKINASILDSAIRSGLTGRTDVSFLPLFNFLYADGHEMLSVGGMIGTESDGRLLGQLDRTQLNFLRDSIVKAPYEIRVPRITRKERLHLDREMPCPDDWRPREFEMKSEDVLAYREIYRHYPAYMEGIL